MALAHAAVTRLLDRRPTRARAASSSARPAAASQPESQGSSEGSLEGRLEGSLEGSPAIVPPRKTEASRFTLGGIIRYAGESMATINGKLLRAGDTIDGGKLLQIDPQSVEMESKGERFTLRM